MVSPAFNSAAIWFKLVLVFRIPGCINLVLWDGAVPVLSIIKAFALKQNMDSDSRRVVRNLVLMFIR